MNASGALFGAQLLEVARLVAPVEDPERMGEVGSGAVNDDSVLPLGLDYNLVAGAAIRLPRGSRLAE